MQVKEIMFPTTKGFSDYISELNRLFPELGDNNDVHNFTALPSHRTSVYHTPINQQLPSTNQSSSSADSLSPDYPDTASRFSTPISSHKRPIVGRKIIGHTEPRLPFESPTYPVSPSFDSGFDSSPVKPRWLPEDLTPQRSLQRSQEQVYELFPERSRDYGFRAQLQSQREQLTPRSAMSMSMSNYSPSALRFSQTPSRLMVSEPPPNFTIRSPQAAANFPSGSSQGNGTSMCTFCRKNGETPVVYMTHTVRARVGNKSIVTCPILRSHVCTTCGVSGDNAHTITYCPVLRSNNNGLPLQSTTITLKNTRVKSNGRRRF